MVRRRSLSDINTFKAYGKADLLSCFPPPSRPRLTLMPPKLAGSPARAAAAEPPSRHRRRKSCNGTTLWAKSNIVKTCNPDLSEPTSPKVTCVGQIKVRPTTNSCKNWQSVMEEIERMHHKKKHSKIKKRLSSPWMEALGFKREVTQFLRCLRNIRFDFRCFGSFPSAEIPSDEDDDRSEENDDDHNDNNKKSKEDFSKVFMIRNCLVDDKDDDDGESNIAPPLNALMLTRCRSAPARSRVEEREEERERREKLVVMRCGEEFSKLSLDIAQETWIGGGIQGFLARSPSCKR